MQIVKDQGIDCGLKRLDAFVFTYAGREAEEKAYKELSAARDAGLKDVSLVDPSLFTLKFRFAFLLIYLAS
jgi:hypothetical protein